MFSVGDSEKVASSDQPPQLPDEIISHCFSFLPAEIILKCGLVCKQWLGASYEEIRWREVCLSEEWNEKEATQTWREWAIAHAKLKHFYRSGNCLHIAPKVTTKTTNSTEFYNKAQPPRIQFLSNIITVQDIDLDKPARIYSQSERIVNHDLFGNRVVFETQTGKVCVWDSVTGKTVYECQEKRNAVSQLGACRFTLSGSVLVTFSQKKDLVTTVRVYYLKTPEANFSFSMHGEVTCAALKETTLAVNMHGFENVVYLIDLENKLTVFHRDTYHAQHRTPFGSVDQMEWLGQSLHIYRDNTHTILSEEWDFSSSESSRKKPTPLKVSDS